MKVRVATWSPTRRSKMIETFLSRPAFDEQAEVIARELLEDIRRRGDSAVMAAMAKYDGVVLRGTELRVSDKDIANAIETVPESTRRHVREAHRRVTDFARRSMRQGWSMPTANGGSLGEFFMPYERVGIYVPGGTAPLASTVIMTATLAQVAGVKEIIACSPCGRDKQINPVVLYAMQLTGVSEIYRVGGVQAIGLMAYGTRRNEPVQKIVGPGGTFVTAAKRLVYGTVALDLVAGPSEIAILADASAPPAWVAADLLSQLEHGTGFEKALMVTDSPELAEKVSEELVRQMRQLPRKALLRKSVAAGGLLLVNVPSLDDGMNIINRFAPEHLELMVENADAWCSKVISAGAVFVGNWTPESVGDFVAGPSHVLPTGGAAKLFSGLTVDDFRRRSSVVSYTETDLREALPTIEAFGAMEGLEAHAHSARIRCAKQA